MVRWEPGAAERLQGAALELFARHGYDETTTEQIAAAAGLSQRTFFRHFADKRDVLFHGQDRFVGAFLDGLAREPADAAPMRLIGSALASAAAFFPDDRRAGARERYRVIEQNPALQERERHKLADLSVRIAAALRDRGIPEPTATLAAESGTTVFGIAFAQWIAAGERRSMDVVAASVLEEWLALHV